MGLFNFGRESGKAPKTPIAPQAEQANAFELAENLRALGITIQNGQISVRGDTVTITGQANSAAEKEKAVLVLGNTKGVAHVDDQISVVQQASEPPSQFYVVQSGDTLSKISKQFYNDPNRYSAIFEANRPMLKDPNEIYPGQTLRIPAQH